MKIQLTGEQKARIEELSEELSQEFSSVEEQSFGDRVALLSQELPRDLRRKLLEFRIHESAEGVCHISGLEVDDDAIGPTPEHWKVRRRPAAAHRLECAFALLASAVGEPIAWRTQQDGTLMHDILPIQGHEGEQLGSGSEELLWWHTEDAFHPYRGDYLGMFCMRNPDRVPTTVCAISEVLLDEESRRCLFEPHFTIRPDESHLAKNALRPVAGDLSDSYRSIERMWNQPQKLEVLFGDPDAPYLRLDPYFMDPADHPRAQQALDKLIKAIDESLWDLVLKPGDVCLLDNYQVVHGRRAFRARFDGSDRWLKRLNLVRDLRKSRDARPSSGSRVIG